MSVFKLSATLNAHSADVRAVVAPFNDTIISASRDKTVKVWTKDGFWNPRDNFVSNGYVNSLAYDEKTTSVLSGGQDKLINVTDLYISDVDPKFVLIGHESNVCALDCDGKEVISGSWDTTAKVWENNLLKYTLEGHSASVWDVKILGNGRYLTCSADKTVKLWSKDKEIRTFVGHLDVVRSLALLPDGVGFISTSNDGTIRVCDFDGKLVQELVGHESFVYDVIVLPNGDIVSAGEDRTIRVWREGKAIQVITLPCVSVWSIASLPNGDIVSGSSDGMVRVFTRDPERTATIDEIKEFNEAVESMALNAQSFDESKTQPPETLQRPGKKEGQVIVVKSPTGINEAHQWSEGKWNKIGEVVSGGTSDQKQEFDGKTWDFVFDVDVQEGAPPLKLPYNASENPYVAAQRFLEKNELPMSFTDQVVDFIAKNTQGVTINQASDTVNPYADVRRAKLVPHTDYLGFTSNNSDAILKGVKKFNETEKSFTDDELKLIENAFQTQDTEYLFKVATTILTNWTNALPGFDIIRLIISTVPAPPEVLGDVFDKGLTPNSPPILFMTFRIISNIFLNTTWGVPIITDTGITTRILNQVALTDGTGKHAVNVANALATVVLNYSAYACKYKSSKIADLVANTLKTKGLEVAQASSEAAYRLSVAWGNLVYVDGGLRAEFEQFKKGIKYNEQRFKDVFEDIAAL